MYLGYSLHFNFTIMQKPVLIHIGEDYANIMINWLHHEVSLGLMRDLYLTDCLSIESSWWSDWEMMWYIKDNL